MDPADFHAMMDQEKQADPDPPEDDDDSPFHDRHYTPWQTNPVNRKNSAAAQKRAILQWRQRINARSPA